MLFSLSVFVCLLQSPAARVLVGAVGRNARAWYAAHPGMARISSVNQETHQLVDEFGRTRFFHGTNVVMKEAPWHRPLEWKPGVSSFGEQDVRNLRDLGLNIVRLGHSWAGTEPERGQYNQSFLDIMRKQTKLAEDYGIYVLVEVHQDCLARQFCGHGAPDWFAKKDWLPKRLRYPVPLKLRPFPVDIDGFPSPPSICSSVDWALSYTSVALGDAFGRFYRNHDGLADAFAAFWQKLASVYVSTSNVVGYNLLNEPWVGNTWTNPGLLIPGVADSRNLEGLWNRVAKRIRSVDKNTLIWFEGVTLDHQAGFRDVPLGDGSKAVHSFHYYKPPQLCSASAVLRRRQRDNKRLKTAGVLTEFTFWMGDKAQMRCLANAVAAADTYMFSWIGWAYENLYRGSSGQPHPELAKHYSRAYPAAIAGVPVSFGFNDADGTLKLRFTSDSSIRAPTEIIVPQRTFPRGYRVRVEPWGSLLQFNPDVRTLALFTAAGVRHGTHISVTITRI